MTTDNEHTPASAPVNRVIGRLPLKGEYCLATKFHDGEAWDQYAVGFYAGEILPGRHQVIDHDGKPFRASGFRRCEPITKEQGDYILHTPGISDTGFRLWDYIHQPKPSDKRADAQENTMTTENHSASAPLQRVVGQVDDIGQCWRDFILGDIDAGFEWALHPMMCNRSDNMERFIMSAKREIEHLRSIVADVKRHCEACPDGVGKFIDDRIAAFESLPNPTCSPAGDNPSGAAGC